MTGIPRERVHTRRAVGWLLVAVVIGYPVAGLLASALDLNSVLASVPLRLLVLALSFSVWIGARRPKPHPGTAWLAAFALFYLVRLLWDLTRGGLDGAGEALAFYGVTVLAPALALWGGAAALDQTKVVRLMFYIGSLICASAVLMHLLGVGQERSLSEATGRLSFEAINPITLGHAAATTLIAALCLLRQPLRAADAPLLPAGCAVAAAVLLLSASRGPVLCLAAGLLVYAAATRRWHWLLLMVAAMLPWLADPNGELWMRFASVSAIEEDWSALERLVLQTNALEQFLSNPFLGSAFVELELQTYPHNLFIETAMALGLVGLAVLLPLLWHVVRSAVAHVKAGQLLLPLLFVQYFVGAQLSGAIYGNAALWSTAAMLLGVRLSRPKRSHTTPALVIGCGSAP